MHKPADLQQRAVRRRHTDELRTVRDQRLRSVQAPEREAAQCAQRGRQQFVDGLAAQVRHEWEQPEQPVEQRFVRELQERRDIRVGERGQVFGQQVRGTDEAREDTVRGPHEKVLGRGLVVHHVRVQRRERTETLSGRTSRRVRGQGRRRQLQEQGLCFRSGLPGKKNLSSNYLRTVFTAPGTYIRDYYYYYFFLQNISKFLFRTCQSYRYILFLNHI